MDGNIDIETDEVFADARKLLGRKPPKRQQRQSRYDHLFDRYGQQFDIDPALLRAQVGQESSFRVNARSPKGAQGLSQFMPATARRFNVDVNDPESSIRGQAEYMRFLLDRFNGDVRLALAGYNAGEGAVDKYKGIPPYRETQDYVRRIMGNYRPTPQRPQIDVNTDPVFASARQMLAQNTPQIDVQTDPVFTQAREMLGQGATPPMAQDNPQAVLPGIVPTPQGDPIDIQTDPVFAQAREMLGQPLEPTNPHGAPFIEQPPIGAVPDNVHGQMPVQQPSVQQPPVQTGVPDRLHGIQQPTVQPSVQPTQVPQEAPQEGVTGNIPLAMPQGFTPSPTLDVEGQQAQLDPNREGLTATQMRYRLPNGESVIAEVGTPNGNRVPIQAQAGQVVQQAQSQRLQESVDMEVLDDGVYTDIEGNDLNAPEFNYDAPIRIDYTTASGQSVPHGVDPRDWAREVIANRLEAEGVPYESTIKYLEAKGFRDLETGEQMDNPGEYFEITRDEINAIQDFAQIDTTINQAVDASKERALAISAKYPQGSLEGDFTIAFINDQVASGLMDRDTADERIKVIKDNYAKHDEDLGVWADLWTIWNQGRAVQNVITSGGRSSGSAGDAHAGYREGYLANHRAELIAKYGDLVTAGREIARLNKKYEGFQLASGSLEGMSRFLGYLAQVPSTLAEGVSIGAEILATAQPGLNLKAEDNPLWQGAEWWRNQVTSKYNKDYDDGWIAQFADGFGQLTAQTFLAPLTGGASLLLPVLEGGTSQFKDATKSGASQAERDLAFIIGGMAAVPEVLLHTKFFKGLLPGGVAKFYDDYIGSIFSKLSKSMGREEAQLATRSMMAGFLTKIPQGAALEVTQEQMENFINTALAKATYQPNATWESALLDAKSLTVIATLGGIGGTFEQVTQSMTNDELLKADDAVREAIEKKIITEAQGEEIMNVAHRTYATRQRVDQQRQGFDVQDEITNKVTDSAVDQRAQLENEQAPPIPQPETALETAPVEPELKITDAEPIYKGDGSDLIPIEAEQDEKTVTNATKDFEPTNGFNETNITPETKKVTDIVEVTEAVKDKQPVNTIPTDSVPFTFDFVRNKQSAPQMGSRFGQDIEPSGRYMQQGRAKDVADRDDMESGSVTFEKPLVIDFGGGYGEDTNWKNVLSKKYDGKVGKALSDAVRADGYDGIVTVDALKSGQKYTSEIVDLTQPKTTKTPKTPDTPKRVDFAVVKKKSDVVAVKSEVSTPEKGKDDSGAEIATKPQKAESTTTVITDAPFKATGKVFTENGKEVGIESRTIPDRDILTSFDKDYPQEFQPRDRGRVASRSQINDIANNLNPELLGESPKASDGRPLVIPVQVKGKTKYAVISGNGRTEAIRQSRRTKKSRSYEKFIKEQKGKRKDIYVGVLDPSTDVTKFAQEANVGSTAKMSAAEQAQIDAKNLTLDHFVPSEDGSIHSAANREFIKGFVANLTPAERSSVMLGDGSLSQEGVSRVRNAVFAKAFGDSDVGNQVVERVSESLDSNIKRITNAMLQSAGGFTELKQMVDDGVRFEGLDITNDLAVAVEKLSFLRDQGTAAEQYVQQQGLFGDTLTPFQKRLLLTLDTHKNSAKALNTVFQQYIKLAHALGDPNQNTLFGEPSEHNAPTLFREAVIQYEKGNAETTQNNLFNTNQGREVQPETSQTSTETDSTQKVNAKRATSDDILKSVVDPVVEGFDSQSESDEILKQVVSPELKEISDKPLLAVHNLSVDNLDNVLRLGALPVPSLAIIDANNPFVSFGDITLVADKNLIDPRATKTNKVFNADSYSVRYPSVTYAYSYDKGKALENEIEAIVGFDARNLLDRVENEGKRGLRDSEIMRLAFLMKNNLARIYKTQPYDKPNILSRYISKHRLFRGHGQDHQLRDHKGVQNAYRQYADDQIARLLKDKNNAFKDTAHGFFYEENGDIDYHKFYGMLTRAYRTVADTVEPKIDTGKTTADFKKIIKRKKAEQAYQDFVDDAYNKLDVNEKIFKGFTNSGNRSYIPHSLENVVRLMKGGARGGENFFYGGGSVRAQVAKQFSSLTEIKDSRDSIVPKEQIQALKDEVNDELHTVTESLKRYYKYDSSGFGYTAAAAQELQSVARRGQSESFKEVPSDVQKDVQDFLSKLRNLPTEYFEAKLDRAVDLNEFTGAIVPKGTPSKYTDALKAKGLKVVEYSDTPNYKQFEAVMFQVASAEAQTEITDATFLDTHDLFPDITSKVNGDEIEVSPKAIELVRRVLNGIRGDVSQSFLGGFLEPGINSKIAKGIADVATQAKENGWDDADVAGVEQLAKDIRGLDNSILYVFDEALPEERGHMASYRASGGKSLKTRISPEAMKAIQESELMKTALEGKFGRQYGNEKPEVQVEELIIKVLSGQSKDYGWNEAQAEAMADVWLDGFLEATPDADLSHFDKVGDYAKTITQNKTRNETGKGKDSSGVTDGRDTQSETSGESKGSKTAAEGSSTDPNVKERSLPDTLKKAGLDADTQYYNQFTNEQGLAEANAKLKKMGLEKAVDYLLNVPMTTDKADAVMAFQVQAIVRDEAARIEADKTSTEHDLDIAKDLRQIGLDIAAHFAELHTKAGQFNQAAAMISQSIEGVMYRLEKLAQKIKRDTGRDVTDATRQDIESKGLMAEEALNENMRLKNEVRNLQKKLDALKSGKLKPKAQNRPAPRQQIKYAKQQLGDIDAQIAQIKKELAKNADEILKMVAWHGSPHQFDKFSTDKIGTGEGAQAYGYGLYFASKEEIADHYKTELGNGQWEINGEPFVPLTTLTNATAGNYAANALSRFKGDKQKAIEWLEDWGREGEAKQLIQNAESINEVAGAKYKVDLKPSEEEYLLWDVPASEQSPQVQQVLQAGLQNVRGSNSPFYNSIGLDMDSPGQTFYRVLSGSLGRNAKNASEYLKGLGIRGIKYLDGTSRSKGEGSYNYVIFDDADVEITDILKKVSDPIEVQLANVGASLILDKPLHEIDRDQFNREMVKIFGDKIKPELATLFGKSFNRRQELLAEAREQTALARLKLEFPESTDAELKTTLKERQAETKEKRTKGAMTKRLASAYEPSVAAQTQAVIDRVQEMAEDDVVEDLATRILTKELNLVDSKRSNRKNYLAAKKLVEEAEKSIAADNRIVQGAIVGSEKRLKQIQNEEILQRHKVKNTQQELARAFRKLERNPLKHTIDTSLQVAGEMRAVMASGDLSGAMRQGFIGNVMFTGASFKGTETLDSPWGTMLKKSWFETDYADHIAQVENHPDFALMIQSGIEFAGAGQSTLSLTKAEENIRTEWAKKIPLLGKEGNEKLGISTSGWLDLSERLYASFLDQQRAAIAETIFTELRSQGHTFESNPRAYKSAAYLINIATGKGQLKQGGKLDGMLKAYGNAFFAPSYMVSRFQMLEMLATFGQLQHGHRTPPGMRMYAAKKAARFNVVLGLPFAALMALGLMAYDPDDPDFLKIRYGKKARFEFLGGLQPPLRFISRVMKRTVMYAAEDITGDKSWKPEHGRGWFSDLTYSGGRFLRGKASPPVSFAVDWAIGKDYIGEPFEWKRAVFSRLVPLAIRDVFDATSEDGIGGALLTLPALLGAGVSYYEDKPEKGKQPISEKITENKDRLKVINTRLGELRQEIRTIDRKNVHLLNARKAEGDALAKERNRINQFLAHPEVFDAKGALKALRTARTKARTSLAGQGVEERKATRAKIDELNTQIREAEQTLRKLSKARSQ